MQKKTTTSTGTPSSILDNILVSETESLIQNFSPKEALDFLLGTLREREKKIILKRFGLLDGKPKTLQKIGREEGVTRERVRQIVNNALKKMSQKAKTENFRATRQLIIESIKNNAGLITEDKLISIVLSASEENEANKNIVRLLLEIEEELEVMEKHPELLPSWSLKGTPKELVLPTIDVLKEILEKEHQLTDHNQVVASLKNHPFYEKNKSVLNPDFIRACMETGHKIIEVEENKWGLKTWREVQPRSVRDVILLEMRAYGKPMHFVEIAKKVNESKFARKATVKTVHNELIRDPNICLLYTSPSPRDS